jgi:3-isopropylmalate/(R)-2-methylmalate dehydratase small subunit
LPSQTVSAGQFKASFEIDEFRKKILLEGLDSIGLTLKLQKEISAYEASNRAINPSPS